MSAGIIATTIICIDLVFMGSSLQCSPGSFRLMEKRKARRSQQAAMAFKIGPNFPESHKNVASQPMSHSEC
jgi:hypothetical protein